MCDDGIDRHQNEDGGPPAKRRVPLLYGNRQALSEAVEAVKRGGKSPVSALNELGIRVSYEVKDQSGPAHCPSFTMLAQVADLTIEGWGRSKRDARAAAARAALAALLTRSGQDVPKREPYPAQMDFTCDDVKPIICRGFQFQLDNSNSIKDAYNFRKPITSPAQSSTMTPASSGQGVLDKMAVPNAVKSPINTLYENYPGLKFHVSFGDGSALDSSIAPSQVGHSMRFKVVCYINDQKFEGYGSSKKLAKLAAASSALAVLEEGKNLQGIEPPPSGLLPQSLADQVGKLVNEKFNELMCHDLVHAKRKVLAGIVMTTTNSIEGAKVIAVTSGTKCVSGEHMSVRGLAVNDCHAEVVARRCLQRYLYAELLKYVNADDPTQPIENSDLEPLVGGGYQLKSSRKIHLYVSTAPCGDGRIFSPHEEQESEPDRHPNRMARGQLRTKIESGEGTIPVKGSSSVIQTWDGVLQGERLLTMSCSDKVARWCVLGLQGALLSCYLAPVYLDSLVLGSLLHPQHMYRAICGRIEGTLSGLPRPFALHRPLLSRAASMEARTPARAPSFSVNWTTPSQAADVINSTTGKLESGQPSLLSKQCMFARWQRIAQVLKPLPQTFNYPEGLPVGKSSPDLSGLRPHLQHLQYAEAKNLCVSYQTSKRLLFESFEKARLGRWVRKPLEQDQFLCELTDVEPEQLFP